MTSGIHEFTAKKLFSAYSRRELSPVHVTEHSLARISSWERRINALYRVDEAGALEAARASEARWRAGKPLSRLDGVPLTIKENIHTRGDPTPVGTRANEDAAPQPHDAPPAARLREAGGVILGKTTMPDYGMLSSGLSSLHGVTRNPWRAKLNPSGSSSGAAAAAAARYAPLHLGTDIGGSVRLPATHCGVFSLKPSLGRVPIHPPYMGRVAGPITRTVADAALMMEILARPDVRDYTSLPFQEISLRELNFKALRIGVLLDMGVGLPVQKDVRETAEAAGNALAAAGCTVEPMRSFLSAEMLDGICRFFEARSYEEVSRLPEARRRKVLPFILEWCSWRAPHFTGTDVMRAYHAVLAMREAAVAATAAYDFVISPCSPVASYSAEAASPSGEPRNALAHIAFTVPFSMSEQPAAAINWRASADGLPLGIQVVGRRFDDAGVLSLCQRIETLRPAQPAWPE
ncbi:MAG TPA: amidase [Burkholderiales bacterium]|nr:amidase [Burkholderiales bacterium]